MAKLMRILTKINKKNEKETFIVYGAVFRNNSS